MTFIEFIPKKHLEIGNYVKYLDEILHKCEKGIEYCKICPNEFVCKELEKDDFGLGNATVFEVLTVIQYALSKIPGYLNPEKRNELREHIRNYISELPIHERKIWENSILDLLLDDKLANLSYKPIAKIGIARTLLTYNSKIGFSAQLKCLHLKNENDPKDIAFNLPREIATKCTHVINQYIQDIHTFPWKDKDNIEYHLEPNITEIIQRCNLNDTELAAALCYYSILINSPIPENIVTIGRLDNQGRTLQVDSLDGKIETVLRELHFIDKIIVPTGSSFSIRVPNYVKMIEIDNFEQAIDIVF